MYLPGAHIAAPILAKLEGLPNVFMYKTYIKAKKWWSYVSLGYKLATLLVAVVPANRADLRTARTD